MSSRSDNTLSTELLTKETLPMTPPRRPRNRIAFGLLAGALALLFAAFGVSTASAASPAWNVLATPNPTAFSSDPASLGVCGNSCADKYNVQLTNVGTVTSHGPITVKFTLPAGLTTQSTPEFEGAFPGAFEYWKCTPTGAGNSLITCIDSTEAIPVGGEPHLIRVPITVDPGVSPDTTLTSTFEVSGGGAPPASISQPTSVNPSVLPEPFAVADLGVDLADDSGAPATRAATHPGSLITSFNATSATNGPNGTEVEPTHATEDVRDVVIDLPPGLIGNPRAAPRCPLSSLVLNSTGVDPGGDSACPAATRVGAISFNGHGSYSSGRQSRPLFNMIPERGYPAEFAFQFAGYPFTIYPSLVGTGAATHIRATVPGIPAAGIVGFQGASATFFGNPAAVDASSEPQIPFFTNPSRCSGEPLTTAIHLDSYQHIGARNADATPDFSDPAWKGATATTPAVTGCEGLAFEPSIEARPTTDQADSPAGLHVDIHLPQQGLEEPQAFSEANLKRAVVTLPEGMVADASLADGLGACTEAQIALSTNAPSTCPDASKLGTVEVDTPLLDHPLPGSVYLATPHQNPFGSLLALYIEVNDAPTGTVVKLPGEVHPDPATGRLTASFDQNPQVPFTDFKLDFFGGPRASLTTPATCGAKTTETELTPYSAPESGPPATPTDSFEITEAPGGGPCLPNEAEAPNDPAFSAGTLNPAAGAYSPFVLKLTRENGSQRLTAIDTTLPPGLTGKLAGVGECSATQIAQAEARHNEGEGALEQASPSCPASSELGTINVGAGSGAPFYAHGHAYLAGPYKGAPLSLVTITPAVAGPFDLGAVVVRVALHVNPASAQITATSDPIPTILDGIPLDVRSLALNVSRNQFTLNPTSCNPLAITATAFAQSSEAALTTPFQVGGCNALAFKPKLSLALKGSVRRTANPALTATLTAKPGEANIARAQVKLPKAAFLDNAHINTICTRVQFAAHSCPPGSVYGSAEATTPLLDYTLKGSVYLRSSSHELPDLVVAFNGPASQPIEVELAGRTDAVKGALRNTFELVPDVPVSSFRLSLFGGKRGLVEISSGFCQAPRAQVNLTAQSGKVYDTSPVVRSSCKHGHKKRHSHRGAHR